MAKTVTLDAKGLNCPLPLINARKSIKSLDAGDSLEVFTTDPGSADDFKSFCDATGNEMLESSEDENRVFRFLIKKV